MYPFFFGCLYDHRLGSKMHRGFPQTTHFVSWKSLLLSIHLRLVKLSRTSITSQVHRSALPRATVGVLSGSQDRKLLSAERADPLRAFHTVHTVTSSVKVSFKSLSVFRQRRTNRLLLATANGCHDHNRTSYPLGHGVCNPYT